MEHQRVFHTLIVIVMCFTLLVFSCPLCLTFWLMIHHLKHGIIHTLCDSTTIGCLIQHQDVRCLIVWWLSNFLTFLVFCFSGGLEKHLVLGGPKMGGPGKWDFLKKCQKVSFGPQNEKNEKNRFFLFFDDFFTFWRFSHLALGVKKVRFSPEKRRRESHVVVVGCATKKRGVHPPLAVGAGTPQKLDTFDTFFHFSGLFPEIFPGIFARFFAFFLRFFCVFFAFFCIFYWKTRFLHRSRLSRSKLLKKMRFLTFFCIFSTFLQKKWKNAKKCTFLGVRAKTFFLGSEMGMKRFWHFFAPRNFRLFFRVFFVFFCVFLRFFAFFYAGWSHRHGKVDF